VGLVIEEHRTADSERPSHLLKKATTPVHVSSKPREGASLAQFALEPHQTSLTAFNPLFPGRSYQRAPHRQVTH
jgi:hypothetical protein